MTEHLRGRDALIPLIVEALEKTKSATGQLVVTASVGSHAMAACVLRIHFSGTPSQNDPRIDLMATSLFVDALKQDLRDAIVVPDDQPDGALVEALHALLIPVRLHGTAAVPVGGDTRAVLLVRSDDPTRSSLSFATGAARKIIRSLMAQGFECHEGVSEVTKPPPPPSRN